MHDVGIAVSVGLVLLGLVFLLRRSTVDQGDIVRKRPRPRIRARQLGLGHRFVARLLRSSHRPPDVTFDVFDNYTRAIDIGAIGLSAPAWTWARSAGQAAEPLLELERLIEALENFSARVRSWRPGRRRERS